MRKSICIVSLILLILIGFFSFNKYYSYISTSKQYKKISIVEENSKKGSLNWKIKNPANGSIQGFSSTTSVNRGGEITFFVSTQKPKTRYKMEIFRLGWYNGDGARLVKTVIDMEGKAQGWWSKDSGPHGLPNITQGTRTLSLTWEPSYVLTIPDDWVTGYYLVLLTDQYNKQTYIPFIIRDDFSSHDFLLQASVTTWQAYNSWGGNSLYGNWNDNTHNWDSQRAYAVSFNRPYDGNGAEGMLNELPTIYWLEKQGYDIGYISSLDLQLKNTSWKPKGFISVYHDEYWSKEMRDNLTSLRDSGVNLAFLDANNIYWKIRLENINKNDQEPRLEICYKDSNIDPDKSSNSITGTWRDLGEPENALIGQMYKGVLSDTHDWIISNPNHWLFNGLKVKKGDTVKGIIGSEFDKVVNNGHTPPNLEVISTSIFSDNSRSKNRQEQESNTTIYKCDSGSLVFSAGTMYWGFGLSNPTNSKYGAENTIIQGVTKNLLSRFLSEPVN